MTRPFCKAPLAANAFTPAGREAYAKGPLHLWDFAKIVNKHKLDTMSFGTLNDWILFVHLEGGVVSGHAIHPSAHRFGDLRPNPLIDAVELSTRVGHPSPIIKDRSYQQRGMLMDGALAPGAWYP